MESRRYKPRLLKGFKDHSPGEARFIQKIYYIFQRIYELYGFCPLDTATIEHEEILLSDYGIDPNKQIYRFSDLERNPVGLRYDLTVSLARFVAMHLNELVFPFKRYQLGKVWRFDKPKKGRLREFFQLDGDIVGVAPYEPEIELLVILYKGFREAGINNFYFRVNDRRYLSSLLEELGVESFKFKDIFRVLDKLESQGEEKVFKELTGKLLLQDFDSALEYERMQEVKIDESTAEKLLRAIKDPAKLKDFLGGFMLLRTSPVWK